MILGLFFASCCVSFIIVIFANDKFPVPVTDRQENILSRMDPVLLELFVQPGQIQPHVLEVAFQNPTVHDQLSKQQLLLRTQIHVAGRCRTLGAHRKNRQPSVEFENCGLDAGQVKVSLLPAHSEEFL